MKKVLIAVISIALLLTSCTNSHPAASPEGYIMEESKVPGLSLEIYEKGVTALNITEDYKIDKVSASDASKQLKALTDEITNLYDKRYKDNEKYNVKTMLVKTAVAVLALDFQMTTPGGGEDGLESHLGDLRRQLDIE